MNELKEICQCAMGYLARREHSELELRRKLKRKFQTDQIEKAIEELKQKDLLSNKRFAESYIRSRINKGFGTLRIAYELGQKGIEKELANYLLLECQQDWNQLIVDVVTKKFGMKNAANAKELAQRIRFLQYRGFSLELINKTVMSKSGSDNSPGSYAKNGAN